MIKYIIYTTLLVSNLSFAVNLQVPIGETTANNNEKTISKPWMNQKVGRVMIFDKSQKIALIGGKSYLINDDTKIYDGLVKKGSLVKFNTNDKDTITDLWIISK